MKKILFVCVHNSGRSQMAEAFMRKLAGDSTIVFSAGTQPSESINSTVMQVMRETGIDISNRIPKLINIQVLKSMDRVITMGCGAEQACPAGIVPMEDWGLENPEGQPVEKVRHIRDQIREKVEKLIEEMKKEEN